MDHQTIATDLLGALWVGIPSEYKSKYSYSIWSQFEDNIRSAAYTSTLSKFLSKITQRLGIEVESKDVERINSVVQSGEDRSILKSLRDDTTMLVLMVRLANEERREELKKKREAKKEKEKKDENVFVSGLYDGSV